MENKISLAIVIVSYNTKVQLKTSLEFLVPQLDLTVDELVVVDNASTDGTVEMLKTDTPNFRAIFNNKNQGFSFACNQGWRSTTSPYVLFINGDVFVLPPAINQIKSKLRESDRIGIVGPELLSEDRKLIQMTWGWEISLFGEVLQKLFSPEVVRRFPILAHLISRLQKNEKDVSTLSGACMAVNRKVLEQINGFDESFQLYFEDVDLCVRCRKLGYKVRFSSEIKVIHLLGQSSRQERSKILLIYQQSHIRFYRKHRLFVELVLLKGYLVIKYLFDAMFWKEGSYRNSVVNIIREARPLLLIDSSPAVTFKRSYVFKKRIWRILFSLLDEIGFFFQQSNSFKKINPHKILVVRLDQMGDVIQSLPLMRSLKEAFPHASLHILTAKLGEDLFRLQGMAEKIMTWECPWFDKSRKSERSWISLQQQIRKENYDCVIDPRGDIRLICFFRMAGIHDSVGFGSTGGGFLLDIQAPWSPEMSVEEKHLELAKSIGIRYLNSSPCFEFKNDPPFLPERVNFRLAVHPLAGTEAKRWPIENFLQVIENLRKNNACEIHLVGSDVQVGQKFEDKLKGNVVNHMGKTSVKELVQLLSECDALLTNDSGPAHIMSALGKKTWILWSGTADPQIWAPQGSHIHLFQQAVSCAPCSLSTTCNVNGHPCLSHILSKNVFEEIHSYILAQQGVIQ